MKFRLLSNEKKILSLEPGVFSFVNLYSLRYLMKHNNDTGFYYAVDGGFLCLLLKYLYGIHVDRISFDYTSIADLVFKTCVCQQYSIAIVGGSEADNQIFVDKLRCTYAEIDIVFSQDGYFSDNKLVSKSIFDVEPRVVLLGLGSDKQDNFAQVLLQQGYKGTIFTCGGFITQTANSKNIDTYYPDIINKLNLRALYRFVYEKHTRKRYLIDYPMSILTLLTNIFRKKVKFETI